MEFEELEEQRREGLRAAELAPAPTSNGITLRERFLRTMHYQHVDHVPNYEFGYWTRTLEEWHAQGLPETVVDESTAYDYFGIERYHVAPVNVGMRSVMPWTVLEEKDGKRIYRDDVGVTAEINLDGNQSIPHFLDYPIKDRETWQPYRRALEDMSGRYPENWDELAVKYGQREYPLGIGIGSLIGTARNLIGFENIALMVYEDPALLEEIVETFCVCVIESVKRALKDVRFDFGAGWEDICFNSGPIVGVDFYKRVITPRYRRIADLMNLHGVDLLQTDCDGNIMPIVSCFLEGGINTMFPIEVHGGSDPVAMRRIHGKQLRLWGGVDKMIFLKDKKAVDAEIERLRPTFEEGAFIPTVDHRVQSDARLDLYKHYLDRKREVFHVGGEPRY
jgi:uroporphyrinogen decarboxylase